jgi:hypothetical protein
MFALGMNGWFSHGHHLRKPKQNGSTIWLGAPPVLNKKNMNPALLTFENNAICFLR